MKTHHKIIFGDSRYMDNIEDKSVHLVVTSPPYPMIELWDDLFSKENLWIKDVLHFLKKKIKINYLKER